MLPLDELNDKERRVLDVAEQLGQQLVHTPLDYVLTPTKIDRIAEGQAKIYVTHRDFPLLRDYSHMFGLFIRVFVDAYAAYLRTFTCTL